MRTGGRAHRWLAPWRLRDHVLEGPSAHRPDPWVPVLQSLLGAAIFSNESQDLLKQDLLKVVLCCVAWSRAMVPDLQTKAAKYETKVAHCEEWARKAPDGPQRVFYEVLAGYYRELATDFRQVLAKRQAA